MSEYEEKQLEKYDRYKQLSEKAKVQSNEAYNKSRRLSVMIPFGQPILVGHHSEGRHRRDIERIDNQMGKCVKLQEKSEYYENKAENIKHSNIISSDDPKAIIKLEQKLKTLELQRTKIKEYNKEARKNGKEQNPRYLLSNLGQNINSITKRIKRIQSLNELNIPDKIINGITISVNKEANRVQLMFPEIPSKEKRTELKSKGFKWSPTNQAWQRYINNWSYHLAKEIAGGVE